MVSICKDCMYSDPFEIKNKDGTTKEYLCCTLSNRVLPMDAHGNCGCFNVDLSEYDICYNCKYYGGGNDWGLFCSHKDMYHHLGNFNDVPCERYEKRKVDIG